jgi:hypothetical protein
MQFIRGEGLDKVLADVRRMRQQSGQPVVAGPSDGSIAHSLLSGQFVARNSTWPGGPTAAPAATSTSAQTVSGP